MEKKKRKKRVNNMAWDYPRFRSRYQWENNPGIEPTTLLKDDDKTTLVYVYPNGEEKTYTTKEFFEEKLAKVLPSVSDGILMAWDYPMFREIFQKENNPDVDPYTLKKRDLKTHLRYVNQFKVESTYTPYNFFNKRLWESMPYRKIEYEMAMDDENFRNTFQQENNPGVDPYTLRKWYDDTPLIYINQYGIKTNYTPNSFFTYKLWKTMPYKKYEMAMDDENFRDTFQQENNLGVDPYTLRKWNDLTPLVHINQYGVKTNYTPDRFFSQKLWESMPYRKKDYEMAMDDENFRNTFQQENNPGVDPYTLRKWYDYTPLIHINQYGVKTNYTPDRFFSQKLWESMPYRKTEYEMAMDDENFRDTFQQENNPGVDPYTLRKWFDFTPLVYINQYGVKTNYTPHRFFSEKLWERMPYIEKDYEMAMDDENFRNTFQQENNPGEDPYKIRKWDKEKRLIYINQYGVLIPYSPDCFFRNELWKTMPYRKPKNGMLVNVLELDDEIGLYVAMEERNKLLEVDIFIPMAFSCPFCGSEFTNRLVDMINVSPKCPFCEDTELYKEVGEEEINGAFLKHDRGGYIHEKDTSL